MTDFANDPIMTRISEALDQFNAGRRADARAAFADIWVDIEPDTGTGGSPFHQCILAHYMADTQDDPLEELKWDRIALAAADSMAKMPEPALTLLSLYPSLHLNLADVLHRTGDNAAARRHVELARATIDALADDGYGQMIRNGIERLAQRLG